MQHNLHSSALTSRRLASSTHSNGLPRSVSMRLLQTPWRGTVHILLPTCRISAHRRKSRAAVARRHRLSQSLNSTSRLVHRSLASCCYPRFPSLCMGFVCRKHAIRRTATARLRSATLQPPSCRRTRRLAPFFRVLAPCQGQ